MSITRNLPTLSSFPWRRLGLSLVTAAGLFSLPSVAQTPDEKPSTVTVVRAGDDSVFNISVQGNVTITIPRAPTASRGTMLKIVNSSDYVIWSGELTASSGSWTTKIGREAASALLVANALKIEFPGAAPTGKDLQVAFFREQFQSQMGSLASQIGSTPLFYDAPDAPAPLTIPSSLTDQSVAASFSMSARRYDEQLKGYYHQLIARHAGASSLWNDLKTAGRVKDWPASAISAQDNAFKAMERTKDEVLALQSASREKANNLIKQWNAASGAEVPVDLQFRDDS
jgi:hypothetical protein